MNSSRRQRARWPFRLVWSLALLTAGCAGPTQADRDNRRLVDAILTAITMKNLTWLEEDAQLATTQHQTGHLTDDEYEHLLSIIGRARSGDWLGAEKQNYKFRKDHPFVREGH